MIKNKKDIIIAISLAVILLVVFLTRINGYLFMEVLQEAKFVAAAIGMANIFDIFSPQLNGTAFFDAGPLYYLLLHISSLIFGGFTEFSARIPSVLIYLATFLLTYILVRRMTNKKYALTVSITTCSTVLLILFATISSPNMLSSCFSIGAILSAVTSTFTDNKKHKQWYYFWFWIGITLSMLTGGLKDIILPLAVVIPVIIATKRQKEFFSFSNFFPGIIILIGLIYATLLLSVKVNNNDNFVHIPELLKSIFTIDFSEKHYLCHYKKCLIVFLAGMMPWLFSFLTMIASYVLRMLKFCKNRYYFSEYKLTNERKVFCISAWAFIVSAILLAIYPQNNYATIIPTIYFGATAVAHYWYCYIESNRHKISIDISSLLLYSAIMIFTVAAVIVYFFFSQIQKTYIESLIPPLITVTLFVAIPGILAIVLKRRVLNYSVHILASILFFFILTGLLFNYINSFGENDLVNFSIKARKDGARLATYDIPNKYSMDYYFKSPVVFNSKMTAEEIFKNYGDTTEVYLVLKLADLAYFDKFFVYEIIATGKQYCEITNIKYLPKDEVKANPEIAPTDEN